MIRRLDHAYWHRELARHDMEFSIYALVVASWNKEMMKQPARERLDFRPFLSFVMDVYGRLEEAREMVPEKAWPGIWNLWRKFTSKGINPLSLEISRTQGPEEWKQWLLGIQEAVTASIQGIGCNDRGPEKSPVEMLA